VDRKREITIKVRKTAEGVERQRIERVFEKWGWFRVNDEGGAEQPGPGDVDMKLEDPDASYPSDQPNVDQHINDQPKEEAEEPSKDAQEGQLDAMLVE